MSIFKYSYFLSILLLSSFLIIIPARTECQNNKVKIGPIPKWVNKISIDTTIASPLKEIGDGYFVVLADKQFNDSTHTGYFHYVQKIISESGIQNGSDISVAFDPTYQNLVFHSIKVIRNHKEINQLNLQAFKIVQAETDREKYLYDGELSAQYLLHDIRKGDIIEYSYSLNGENPVYKNKFYKDLEVEFGDPVGKIYYRLILRKNDTVQVKNFKTDAVVKKSPKGNEYILDITNINAVKPDDNLPSWYCAYGYIQFSEYSSWSDFAKWITGLFKTPESISPELKAKIKELRKKNPADKDFILACIHFVQDEIRYEGIEIGQNNQKPYPPSQVFAQRFGDCKDKSFLLCTMLRTEGFSADPVLVNTYNNQAVGNWLPSPSDFNHCISKITLGGKVYWIDATITLQRGPLDSLSFPDYGLGLVVNSSTTALDTIPEKILGRIKTNEKYILGDTASVSSLTVITKYYGSDADNMRVYFANNSRTDIEKAYTTFYAKSYPEIAMADSVIYTDDEKSNIIITTEKYIIQDLWQKMDNGWKAPFSAENIRSKIIVPTSILRKTPIGLRYPIDFTQTIDISTPVAWKIESDDIAENSDGFMFTYSRNDTDGIIHLNYHLKITKNFIEADELDTYLKNAGEALDYIGYSLLWNPNYKATVARLATSTINWMMAFIGISFLFFIVLVLQKTYTIDFNISAYRESSKLIGGWLILVAIGLFLTPLNVAYAIYHNAFFNLAEWNLLTNPGTSSYNPGQSILLVLELLGNIFLAAYSIYVLILFFKKRTSLPKSIIILFAFDFVFVLLDILGVVHTGIKNSLDSDCWKHVIRALIPALIWIPYFLVSKRVKETFTKTYKEQSISMANPPINIEN